MILRAEDFHAEEEKGRESADLANGDGPESHGADDNGHVRIKGPQTDETPSTVVAAIGQWRPLVHALAFLARTN